MSKWLVSTLLIGFPWLFLTVPAGAQGPRRTSPSPPRVEERLPEDAGIVNVKDSPFFARGDGVSDDTSALRAALASEPVSGASGVTIFLPPGVYRLTGPLTLPEHGVTLQGAGTRRTVLSLDDRRPFFGDPSSPEPLVTVPCPEGGGMGSPWRYSILNLTVDVGSGNPGVVGLELGGAELASICNVTIRSEDDEGSGSTGLSFVKNSGGSAAARRVRIEGFDLGVEVIGADRNVVLDSLELEGQGLVGISNLWGLLSIRGLTSDNEVPVLDNRASDLTGRAWGVSVLVDAVLRGGAADTSAVTNEASLALRNIVATGYRSALNQEGRVIEGKSISGDWFSPRALSLFASTASSLNLRARRTPRLPWGDARRWTNVESFGADGSDQLDDTSAIQSAIDGGNRTLYFPSGEYFVSQTLVVRGRTQRLVFFESRVSADGALLLSSDPVFEVGEGTGRLVSFERGEILPGSGPGVLHTSADRILALRGGSFGAYVGSGPGQVFLEDARIDSLVVSQGHRVRGSQVWADGPSNKLVNVGSEVWMAGLRTEGPGTPVTNLDEAQTEVLGGLFLSRKDQLLQQPMFVNRESSLFAVVGESVAATPAQAHELIVEEVQDGVTRQLFRAEVPRRGPLGLGAQICCYVGTPSTDSPPLAGPILLYEFDESSGNSARDSSGVGPDAFLNGAAFSSGGISGNCLHFDGIDDFAALPTDYLNNEEGAVSLWFRASPQSADSTMLFYATSSSLPTANGFGSEDELHLHLTRDGQVQFFIEDNRTDLLLTSVESYTDDLWHHAVASWDRDGFTELFVDGRREGLIRRPFDPFSFSGTVRLGRANASRYFKGRLDQVTVFPRPVSHGEAMDLYFSALPYTNYAPAVDAGSDFTVQDASFSGMLAGQVRDDGQPFSLLTSLWSKVSGPGMVNFGAPTGLAGPVTFESIGTYVLQLSASDADESAVDEVTVQVYDPLAAPWSNQDLGDVGGSGWATEEVLGQSMTLHGSGSGLGSDPFGEENDGFHFVHRSLGSSAGVELVASILESPQDAPRARAGVMMRQDSSPTGANVFVGVSGDGRILFQGRAEAFGKTVEHRNLASPAGPLWVRLRRTGISEVEGAYSVDGVNWVDLGTVSIGFGGASSVGLALSSGARGTVGSGRFTDVSFGSY